MAKVELKQPIVDEIANSIKDAQAVVPVSYTHLMIAGLPVHTAIATNKMSSFMAVSYTHL